jgi:hypothetical protein
MSAKKNVMIKKMFCPGLAIMKIESVELVERESQPGPGKHALVGAIYGLLIGTVFVITIATVDRLLYPDLPLGIDWSLLAARWGWIGLGLALIGGLTSLFSETWAGLLAGALTAGLLALVNSLLLSPTTTGVKLLVLLFTLIPIAVTTLPVTWLLRWLVEKHEGALQSKSYVQQIASLVLIAIVLGAGTGYFFKMPRRAVEAVRFVHELLQTAPQDEKSSIHNLPGLQNHAGMSYELLQKPSEFSTEGFDIRAEYEDGYSVNCVVVVYPQREPYLSACKSVEN